MAQWGEELLANGDFAARSALMARAAKDYRIETACMAKLAGDDGKPRQIADISLGSEANRLYSAFAWGIECVIFVIGLFSEETRHLWL